MTELFRPYNHVTGSDNYPLFATREFAQEFIDRHSKTYAYATSTENKTNFTLRTIPVNFDKNSLFYKRLYSYGLTGL